MELVQTVRYDPPVGKEKSKGGLFSPHRSAVGGTSLDGASSGEESLPAAGAGGAGKLVYIRTKPRSLVAARDFAFYAVRIDPLSIGAPAGSFVFLHVSADSPLNKAAPHAASTTAPEPGTPEFAELLGVPHVHGVVRGDVCSMLVIEPTGVESSTITYCVDMNPSGWIPHFLRDATADDLPLPIGHLRKMLEKRFEEESKLTVDQVARKRVEERKQQREVESLGADIIDDVRTTLAQLHSEESLLRSRLQKLREDERQSGLDLSELIARVENDLRRIKERIRRG